MWLKHQRETLSVCNRKEEEVFCIAAGVRRLHTGRNRPADVQYEGLDCPRNAGGLHSVHHPVQREVRLV
jgi:hypothetical protein